jgi:hypothetical protein
LGRGPDHRKAFRINKHQWKRRNDIYALS